MIAGLVLVLLVLTARYSGRRGPRAGYLLVAVSVLWLVANKPMEGTVMIEFGDKHGLTPADVVGLVTLALGLRQAWPDLVRRTRRVFAGRRP